MARYIAGAAACALLLTGVFFLWQSRAAESPTLSKAPEPRFAAAALLNGSPLEAPEASPKSREEKRFSRADKNKDGKVEAEEVLGARRKAFAKLDANGNGSLTFDEWAAKTINKFQGADADRSGWLTPAEYATTAPRATRRQRCGC